MVKCDEISASPALRLYHTMAMPVVVGWLLVTLRLMLHVPWLRLNRFLVEMVEALQALGKGKKAVVQQRPTLLIVGDGLAEGVGDWVTLGQLAGLQRRLAAHIAADDKV